MTQCCKRIKDTVQKLASDHKDIHSSVSRVGKAIDKVFGLCFDCIITLQHTCGVCSASQNLSYSELNILPVGSTVLAFRTHCRQPVPSETAQISEFLTDHTLWILQDVEIFRVLSLQQNAFFNVCLSKKYSWFLHMRVYIFLVNCQQQVTLKYRFAENFLRKAFCISFRDVTEFRSFILQQCS